MKDSVELSSIVTVRFGSSFSFQFFILDHSRKCEATFKLAGEIESSCHLHKVALTTSQPLLGRPRHSSRLSSTPAPSLEKKIVLHSIPEVRATMANLIVSLHRDKIDFKRFSKSIQCIRFNEIIRFDAIDSMQWIVMDCARRMTPPQERGMTGTPAHFDAGVEPCQTFF